MVRWPTLGVALCSIAVWVTACSGGNSSSSPTSATTLGNQPSGPTAGPNPSPGSVPDIPIGTGTAVVTAVGDIGWCGSPGLPLTARLLDSIGGVVLLAGDLAYMNGRLDDFNKCFEPDYGRFRSRWRPSPGNHEWDGGQIGQGYFSYFGDAAGPARRGYYSFRAAAWLVLMLNSAVPADTASAQYQWVREELRTNPTRCTLAVWHHPYVSSGPNGPNNFMRDMWQLLYENHAEVVIGGHDHFYERFGPQNSAYESDREHGIRQFIAGTGGAMLYRPATRFPNSEQIVEAYGVLKLTLQPTFYEWEFINAQTNASVDRGVGQCH
jgi:calcineurin-like phosphoesterase family protein